MLCGKLHRAPLGLHLSFSDTRSPYSSLLALLQGMAAITAHAVHDDEDIFLGKSAITVKRNTDLFAPPVWNFNLFETATRHSSRISAKIV